MPNWCFTNINMYGEKKNVEWLYHKIEEWTASDDINKSDFKRNWLGNIVIGAGLATYDELCNGNSVRIEQPPRCRGSLTYLDISREGTELIIDTETAWAPMLKMWDMINNKYNLNLEITYYAEEPGCGIFASNDPIEIGQYYVDVFESNYKIESIIGGHELCDHCDERIVKELIQKLLGTSEDNMDRLLSSFDESDYSCCVSIHPIEYVNVSEWG